MESYLSLYSGKEILFKRLHSRLCTLNNNQEHNSTTGWILFTIHNFLKTQLGDHFPSPQLNQSPVLLHVFMHIVNVPLQFTLRYCPLFNQQPECLYSPEKKYTLPSCSWVSHLQTYAFPLLFQLKACFFF